jgi:DNA polymerase/3'-5' exonuclease PolX
MNDIIINQFKLLIKQILFDIDFSNDKQKLINSFRLNSIKNALKVIESVNFKITSSEQLKNYKNIGQGTLKRIDEILKTGKLQEVKITEKQENYILLFEELEKIYGIGRKTAYDLFSKYNVKSINDLIYKIKSGQIVNLPKNILTGLKYYDKIKCNIPRETIDKILPFLKNELLSIDPHLLGTICGSYRRLKHTVNDIDFLIVHPKLVTEKDINKSKINYLETFIKNLIKKKYIIASLTRSDVKTTYRGIFKGYIRIDIRFIPYESFYSAYLYFTGSGDFNKKIRLHANHLGYTLSEYGLFDSSDKMVKINSEKDIFNILGMEYLTPELRH